MKLTPEWQRLARALCSQAQVAISAGDTERAHDLIQDVMDIFLGKGPGMYEHYVEKPPRGIYASEIGRSDAA